MELLDSMKLHEKIKQVKAVLLDVDGVITDTMPRHCDAWLKAFQDLHQVSLTREEIYQREGEKCEVSVRQILERFGKTVTDDDIHTLVNYKADLFHLPEAAPFFEGIPEFITSLKDSKDLALVTGTQRVEIEQLFDAFFLRNFKAVVTSTEVENGKPHPEPFLTALESLGLAPSEALVVENAPLGVASARAAGITVLALGTSLKAESLSEADFFLPDHGSLYAAFSINL